MMILTVKATLEPLENVIVQPYTSKVVRQVLFKIAEATESIKLIEVMSSNAPFKPYSMTPLYFNGRPLYKKPGDRDPVVLWAGRRYSFRSSFIISDVNDVNIAWGFMGTLNIYGNKRIRMYIDDIELLHEDALGIPVKYRRTLAINFETPTILQLPKLRKRSKVNRYTLLPIPSLIFYSLKELWNRYADSKIDVASWRADYSMLLMDYDIKPVTVLYDKKRKIRGFTGRTLYMIMTRSNRILSALSKLLHYATLFNVGKSRSIGFGVVTVHSFAKTKAKTSF